MAGLAAHRAGLSGILSQTPKARPATVGPFFSPRLPRCTALPGTNGAATGLHSRKRIPSFTPTRTKARGRMADAAAAVIDKGMVRLQVAAARQEESGRGVARMPRTAFQAL